jgi:dihydroorotate dehydrogenase
MSNRALILAHNRAFLSLPGSRKTTLIYRLFFRFLVLARIDGESAHGVAALGLRAITTVPGGQALLRRLLGSCDPGLRVWALGMEFPSPLGLAAGVDSNASWFEGLGALGFGSVEVGTVTARKQDGNDRPRVFRLLADRAILNRRGFPNVGAEVVADRLGRRSDGPIVGVNVGKSMDVPLDRAGSDYQESVRRLAPLADYVVLNVSSPNTPGLRDMQSVERLRELIADARSEIENVEARVPLLIKIAPDLSDEEIRAIADLAVSVELDGIIAVNTTVSRGDLNAPSAIPTSVADGGISGAPLKVRALEVLRLLRSRVGDSVTLVSVGGIETSDDVWERILAGATLVQAHTGFVYGGPLWPRRINRGLSHRLRAAGVSSIQELVGKEGSTGDPANAQRSATNGVVGRPDPLEHGESIARPNPQTARVA